MNRKAFVVQVELEIQSVTCPGVWLCSNGKVSLQLYTLNSCVQTASKKPIFPILFHEKFNFYKNFYSSHRLSDLQNELSNEWIYLELIQWKNCETGNVLGSFQTTLDELLFPSAYRGSVAGVDVDLLLETTKAFPGTIAPKVEISTRTTIDEIMCKCIEDPSKGVVVNPKLLMSMRTVPKSKNLRRKVCHTVGFSRARSQFKSCKPKPAFCYRKADDYLINRKIQYNHLGTDFVPSKSLEGMIKRCKQLTKPPPCKSDVVCVRKRRQCPCTLRMCACGSRHLENDCQLCSKYKGYFTLRNSPRSSSPSPLMQKKKNITSVKPLLTNRIYKDCKNVHPKCYTQNYCCCCCEIESPKIQKADRATSPNPSAKLKLSDDNNDDDDEDEGICCCTKSDRRSLAQKLHEKLTKTLDLLPKSFEVPCYDNKEVGCDCDNCCKNQSPYSPTIQGEANKTELSQNFKQIYTKLNELTNNKVKNWKSSCLPDCTMHKCLC